MNDRYGDILSDDHRDRRSNYPSVAADRGLFVEDRASGFYGEIIDLQKGMVTLKGRHDLKRIFSLKPGGFLIEGKPVTLVPPKSSMSRPVRQTASGSVASRQPVPARIAQASRIWSEGKHDAELIEHVWGDDLRELGIVVEPMHGVDHLATLVEEFRPGPSRRLGVLVDHLVPGSKEARLASSVSGEFVLVTGHPFVDVWECIWPKVAGLSAWPVVPKGEPYKEGLCRRLGVPVDGFWPKLRNRVNSYTALRPELVGAVERLIDFVAAEP